MTIYQLVCELLPKLEIERAQLSNFCINANNTPRARTLDQLIPLLYIEKSVQEQTARIHNIELPETD